MVQRTNTAPLPPQQPRDVYLADVLIDGMRAYYARTSWGLMLGPLTVDPRFFMDHEVIEHLHDVLDFVDPVRPRLTLLPSTDAPGDAPSGPTDRPVARLGLLPSLVSQPPQARPAERRLGPS